MAQPTDMTVTRLLEQLESGHRSALDQLFPLVYAELRALAHGHRQRWHGDETLGTTALVNEAYRHLAVGTAGEIAVRVTPASASYNRLDPEADFLAVSVDAGRTWTKHAPPATLIWPERSAWHPDSLNRWVQPLAWDAAGNLYHVWSEGRELMLGRSMERGETWERWCIANDPERVMFPYLVAGGEGDLAATWFSGIGDGHLRGNVALITFASEGTAPVVAHAEPILGNAWTRTGDHRITAGEYFPVTFLRNGDVGAAITVANPNTEESADSPGGGSSAGRAHQGCRQRSHAGSIPSWIRRSRRRRSVRLLSRSFPWHALHAAM